MAFLFLFFGATHFTTIVCIVLTHAFHNTLTLHCDAYFLSSFQLLYTVTFISFPFQPTKQIYISCLYLPFSSHLSLTTFSTFHASLIVRLTLSLAVCRIHIVSLKWWLLFTLSSHLAPTTASLLTTQIKELNTRELFIPSPTNLPVILFFVLTTSHTHPLPLCSPQMHF